MHRFGQAVDSTGMAISRIGNGQMVYVNLKKLCVWLKSINTALGIFGAFTNSFHF